MCSAINRSGALMRSESTIANAVWIARETYFGSASNGTEVAALPDTNDVKVWSVLGLGMNVLGSSMSCDSWSATAGINVLESRREVWYPPCPSSTAKKRRSPAGVLGEGSRSIIAYEFASSMGSFDARCAVVWRHTTPSGRGVRCEDAWAFRRSSTAVGVSKGRLSVDMTRFPSGPLSLTGRLNVPWTVRLEE